MESKYIVKLYPAGNGFNLEVERQSQVSGDAPVLSKTWGIAVQPGFDLTAPLPCMWEDDTEITPVYLPEEAKAEILAKWAEIEA